jgi:hypothetical protein
VEDCSQTFGMVFDFRMLAKIKKEAVAGEPGRESRYDKGACSVNRGVMAINTNFWLIKNITGHIEWWLNHFERGKSTLYR